MKLAFSNLAWSFENRLKAYNVLSARGFTGLEIAPGLLFAGEDDPRVPSEASLRERRREMEGAGLSLVSMQSLLFGVEGAELFGAPEARQRLVDGLTRAIDLAGRMGITNLAFGSLRHRVIPPGWTPDEVIACVRAVFLPLAARAAQAGTVLALEPIAAAYGTNFMTTLPDTLAVVRAIDHPAVTLNFDMGALHMTGTLGKTGDYIAAAGRHISHLHLSAPFLGPAPASREEAATVLRALAGIGYQRWVSVEMKQAVPDELEAVAQAADRLRAAVASLQAPTPRPTP